MRDRPSGSLAAALVTMALTATGCAGATSEPTVAGPPPTSLAVLGTATSGDDGTRGGFCAGVLIAPRKVLTAAHCLRKRTSSAVEVRVLDRSACRTTVRRRARTAARVTAGDAAVVRLRGRVPASAAEPLPVGDMPATGAEVIAWGWGPGPPGVGCVPRPARLRVASDAECADLVGEDGVGVYFCAVLAGETNTCAGDTGGPVLDQQGRLVGITVAGRGCGGDGAARYWTAANLLHRAG